MPRVRILSLLLGSLLLSGMAQAADGWARLKIGMTRTETHAVLGDALVTNEARGFMVAIYDSQAEVVFVRGQVVSWTAPAGSRIAAAPVDAWEFAAWEFAQRPVARATPKGSRPALRKRGTATLPAYRL